MKDLFLLYGITLGKRYTYKQKVLFINTFSQHMMDLGYNVQLQDVKKKTHTTTNLLVGDVTNAKRIFISHYDTGNRMFLPYVYHPFHAEKNIKQETMQLIIQFIMTMLCAFGMYLLLKNFMTNPFHLQALGIIISLGLLATIFIIHKGIANAFNYNQNSAAIVLMERLAEKLKGTDTAFILCDGGVGGYSGYKQLKEWMTQERNQREFIFLDAIAHGEKMVLAHRKHYKNNATSFIKHSELDIVDKEFKEDRANQTPLYFFHNCLYLTSGSIQNKEFVVYHTRSKKDYMVDLARMSAIEKTIITYCKGGKRDDN